jgi:hypothetical protein
VSTKIWYWPTDGNKALAVELSPSVMEREGPFASIAGTSSESITGAVVSTTYGARWSLRYRHTWDTRGSGQALRRQLFALVNHLQRGGTCMVAENATYAWAAFATVLPDRNSTRISVGPSLFENLVSAPSVNGRELVVQSDPDTAMAELRLCSAHTGGVAPYVDLSTDCAFAYAQSATWVLVREVGSWPALRLPASERSSPILSHRYDRVFELDLPLEEDPDAIATLQTVTPPGATTEGANPTENATSIDYTIPGGWLW